MKFLYDKFFFLSLDAAQLVILSQTHYKKRIKPRTPRLQQPPKDSLKPKYASELIEKEP